jgi:hypothetical protein
MTSKIQHVAERNRRAATRHERPAEDQMSHSNDHHPNKSVGMWAWFLPAAYVFHVAEEAFGGHGLMEWMAAGGGVRLSKAEFLGLQVVAACIMCLAAWAARKSKVWRWPLVSGATVVLVNGIWHIAVCAMTRSYVPGLWTGLFLFVPVGGILLLRLRCLMSPWLFASAIAVGIVVHGATLWIVLRTPGLRLGMVRAGATGP